MFFSSSSGFSHTQQQDKKQQIPVVAAVTMTDVMIPTIMKGTTRISSNSVVTPLWVSFMASIVVLVSNVQGYSHTYQTRGSCANALVPNVYERCVQGWKDDNFFLPLPAPLILDEGDSDTGVGLEICRIPPAALREKIIGCDTDEAGQHWTMHYKVVNPGWLTLPVKDHRGRVDFVQEGDSVKVDWKVDWTPYPLCELFIGIGIKLIIDQLVRYTTMPATPTDE